MLDFYTFIDNIYIYSTTLDEWGLNAVENTPTMVKGFIRETTENIEFKNQKGKSVLSKYTISLSGSENIKCMDFIGVDVNGKIEKHEILNIKPVRDLSGECIIYKVYI